MTYTTTYQLYDIFNQLIERKRMRVHKCNSEQHCKEKLTAYLKKKNYNFGRVDIIVEDDFMSYFNEIFK